ncbi:hypothetical protein [Kaarinaea lacus]
MNAFKLDLMTVLALFVILAVIVTMALGANDDEKTSMGAFSQPNSGIATFTTADAPAGSAPATFRSSNAVSPSSKLVSSWR